MKLWKRERVHRIAVGDRITLRRWHHNGEQLRVASIDLSWGGPNSGTTIHCQSLDHLRIPPEPKGRWLRWPNKKPQPSKENQ